MVNVLIVEDSRVVSEYLYYILSKDPQIQVVGNVSNGKQAIEFIKEHKPDVVSMDIEMPIMNGLEATRIIMSTTPLPIIIVTASRNANEVATSMEALAAGALAIIEKPVGIGHPDEKRLSEQLVMLVKLMAEVKVVSRKFKKQAPLKQIEMPTKSVLPRTSLPKTQVVAIGVSSGGPQTLNKVFSKISGKFPVPILVVQHIAEGFLSGLVGWLVKNTAIPILVAEEGMALLPGHVYFAPDRRHLGVSKSGKVILAECENGSTLCPSVAYLFSSITKVYGEAGLGIILTGMGSDGAQELKTMKDTGATTIAQDKESSLIHGMPGVAIKIGAAKHVMSACEIGQLLYELELKVR